MELQGFQVPFFKNTISSFPFVPAPHDAVMKAVCNWFEFEGREYDFAFVRDITDRTQAAARIKHLNRVYAMLSGVTSTGRPTATPILTAALADSPVF